MIPITLAQAATIGAGTSFEWPIVVAIGTLFLWAGRQQATLAQQQAELTRAHSAVEAVKQDVALHREQMRETREKDRAEVAVLSHKTVTNEVVLGRVDLMVSDIHKSLFQKARESA